MLAESVPPVRFGVDQCGIKQSHCAQICDLQIRMQRLIAWDARQKPGDASLGTTKNSGHGDGQSPGQRHDAPAVFESRQIIDSQNPRC